MCLRDHRGSGFVYRSASDSITTFEVDAVSMAGEEGKRLV